MPAEIENVGCISEISIMDILVFSSITSLTSHCHGLDTRGWGWAEQEPFPSSDQSCVAMWGPSICPSLVTCPFCPSPPQSPVEVTPFWFPIPGQKQMRRPEDILGGEDLDALYLLSPQYDTEHFPGLISLLSQQLFGMRTLMKPPFYSGGKGDFKRWRTCPRPRSQGLLKPGFSHMSLNSLAT